jgi:hypothetical protein
LARGAHAATVASAIGGRQPAHEHGHLGAAVARIMLAAIAER